MRRRAESSIPGAARGCSNSILQSRQVISLRSLWSLSLSVESQRRRQKQVIVQKVREAEARQGG